MSASLRAMSLLVSVTCLSWSGSQTRPPSEQGADDRASLHRALADARARWEAHKPLNYEFVLSMPTSARNRWSRQFAAYRVTAGSGATLAPPAGSLADVFQGRRTLDAVFSLVLERLDSVPTPVSVRYDDELGYPAEASLGEVSFTVPTFRAFSRTGDVAEPFVLSQHVNHCGTGASDPTFLGVCPDYSIAMWGDGTVAYEGEAGVSTLGRHQHHVTPDAVQHLVQAIGTSRFFELADDYHDVPGMTVDHAPELWLTVRVDGRQKTVHDFYGAPDALRLLESTVETVTDSRRYTGREPRP